MKGCRASQLPSYLDEFMWHERFGQTKADAFNNIAYFRTIHILIFSLDL